MSPAVIAGVALLGGVGALARFALDGAISGAALPLGTLAVNLTGAFLLGLLVGATASEDTLHLLGTGLLGAYTTFSTWMLESHRLAEDGRLPLGLLNLAGSLALGLLAVWLGRGL